MHVGKSQGARGRGGVWCTYRVLDGAKSITHRVFDLVNGVLVGAFDEHSARLGALAVLNESELVVPESLLRHLRAAKEIAADVQRKGQTGKR